MKVDEIKACRVLAAALAGILVAVIVRNSWLSDDAYITLRVVDNFVSGHGLRWNVADRVQAYTHPLWLFWVSAFYWVFPKPYFTLLGVSILTSVVAVALLVRLHWQRPLGLVPVLCTLILSKAFVDFSTSGLENPMTHVLLLAIYATHWRTGHRRWRSPGSRAVLVVAFLTACAMLNRPDTLLLALPVLVIEAWRVGRERGWLRTLVAGALGFSPLILWQGFSIFYYGSAVANTAYAKLNTGIPERQLIAQGLHYFTATLRQDPVTLLAIAVVPVAVVIYRRWTLLPAWIGIALYLGYVLWIGGDFMAGRFLTGPLLLSLLLLAKLPVRAWVVVPAVAVLLILGYANGRSLRGVAGEVDRKVKLRDFHGVIDERRFYFGSTAWIGVREGAPLPAGGRARLGRKARDEALKRARPMVKVRRTIGMFGYFAGPRVHVVDRLGLADALVARLPVADPTDWRIGHFARKLPTGYVATIRGGENRIEDPSLAAYYEHLSEVIRGDLWSWKRLRTVAKLNLGHYDHYLDAYLEKYPERRLRPARRAGGGGAGVAVRRLPRLPTGGPGGEP